MNKKYLIALILLLITIGTVSAGTVHVSTSDSFYFYSLDSPAANDDYYAAIVVDGVPYYLANDEYDELCDYSYSFASGFLKQFHDYSSSEDIYMGSVKVGTVRNPGQPIGDFETGVDKEFSFTYKTGKVGLNKNAHIITNLNL